MTTTPEDFTRDVIAHTHKGLDWAEQTLGEYSGVLPIRILTQHIAAARGRTNRLGNTRTTGGRMRAGQDLERSLRNVHELVVRGGGSRDGHLQDVLYDLIVLAENVASGFRPDEAALADARERLADLTPTPPDAP